MSTGRYCITDLRTGTKTVVEPLSERSQRVTDKAWEPGGAQWVEGGSVPREDAVVTLENGFTNIREENGSGL